MRHKLTELLDSEAFKEVRKKISDIVGSNFNLSKLNVAIRESVQPEEVIMALAAVLSLSHTNIFPEMTYAQITHLLNQQFVLQYSPHTVMRLLKENPVEMEELETYLRKVRADFRKRDLS